MKLSKILWAVDPFSEFNIHQHTVKAFQAIRRFQPKTIEPVYVISPPITLLPSISEWELLDEAVQTAKKALKQRTAKLRWKELQPGRILTQPSHSIKNAVKTLIEYATEQKADLIVLSTHGRKGIRRGILGSFAETLFLISPIPVFIVNPDCRVPTKIDQILFPTDFSSHSKKALEKLLPILEQRGCSLTLYHKVEWITEFTTHSLHMPHYAQFLKEEVKRRRKEAAHYENMAKNRGIPTKVVIDDRKGEIDRATVNYAKKNQVDLIALASEHGELGVLLLGSLARRILRAAPCPIWVFHPEIARTTKPKGQKKVEQMTQSFSLAGVK